MKPGFRAAALVWAAAAAFVVWLYADGLKAWFIGDDFAWLRLLGQVHGERDFLIAMFAPRAEGTIRPLSERGFFMLFQSVFGLASLPMRLCAFATMAANIALVGWLARRLSGSRIAAFVAPVVWAANSALVTPMYWNSAYNELLCPLCLLGATALLIRYTETGEPKWWWRQLAVFILGFGALEINVVYPAIAAAWLLLHATLAENGHRSASESPPARKYRPIGIGAVQPAAPLFLISIVYFLIHGAASPLPASGIYAIHIDSRILSTFRQYAHWTFLPQIASKRGYSALFQRLAVLFPAFALAAYAVSDLRRRRFAPLFCVTWFLVTLAPVLALPDHRMDYYLTIPLIGPALMAGSGAGAAFSRPKARGLLLRGITLGAIGIYLVAMIPAARFEMRWWHARTLPIRGMVLGAAAAHESHPGKAIALDGVTTELYEDAIEDEPFRSVGLTAVYLTPGTQDNVHTGDDTGPLERAVLEPAVMRHALASDAIVVYSVVSNHLRNITKEYERSAPDRLPNSEPHRVEVGNPLYSYLLGPEWLTLEEGFRWMPGRASVRLGGPRSVKDRLILEGLCPEEQLQNGPVHLSVSVDGIPLRVTEFSHPDDGFRRQYDLPADLVGRPGVTVQLEVDRTSHVGGRDLGLVFGTISVH